MLAFVLPSSSCHLDSFGLEWLLISSRGVAHVSPVKGQSYIVHTHIVSPVGTFPSSTMRFDNINIDTVEPLPLSHGFTYLLTCIDRFTRWPEAFPLPDISALTIARAFVAG